jgi:hypothetical protein
MNPMGFLTEEELKSYTQSTPTTEGMKKEFGMKVAGPEPTRYGDWERKGRVTDF